jgi:hypothetical protein
MHHVMAIVKFIIIPEILTQLVARLLEDRGDVLLQP